MFDLENSIADWRQQMLAAGIKTPVPLEELESHLREEIEQQMKSGLSEREIFNSAVQNIGQAGLLKTEFKKAGGFISWLGENKSARINRIFGALWLAFCSWVFFGFASQFAGSLNLQSFQKLRPTADLYVFVIVEIIFLRGMVASILLFCGKNKDARTIQFIAAFLIVALFVPQIIDLKKPSALAIALSVVFAAFNMASIWLLRSPKQNEPNSAAK
jgi:hypothetical protein